MTMPHERTRAVIHTRDFLVELSANTELPRELRSRAEHLLRHYPSAAEVRLAGKGEELHARLANWPNVFASSES